MNVCEIFISRYKVNGFLYDEETRRHTLNGIHIPSLSQIVQSDYSKINPGILERKQTLGVQFHKAIELFINDDLDESTFPDEFPELVLPFESFKEYYLSVDKNDGVMTLAVEQPFCNAKLKYCGKPDRVKEDAIVDWKLREYDPMLDPVRMAGYAGLFSDFPPKKLSVVSFDLKGNRKIHDAEKKGAWGMFRELLKHYWDEIEFTELLEGWRKSI